MAYPPRWHLADLLDFESLLASDAAASDDALRTRDREIFQSHIHDIASGSEGANVGRAAAFHRWLEARRAQEGSGLPGDSVRAGWETLIVLTVVCGLVLGAAVCAAVLRYPGGEPVNVAVFLGAILGPQFLLPLLFGMLWLLLRWRAGQAVFSRIVCWLGMQLRRLPGKDRARVQTAMAALERRRDTYGALGKWPLLIATQVFAVTFNVGAICALLAHVPTRELRFGWQTTLEISSAQAVPAVALAALPWRWAPAAHPTAEQVVATRFAPGQSLATLPGEAARAWWPFLAYAIGCYGLVLRGAVLVFALWRLRAVLGGLRFEHAEANALWRRLTGPLIATPTSTALLLVPAGAESGTPHAGMGGTIWLLIAHECGRTDADLAGAAQRGHGWRATRTQRVKIDSRSAEAALVAELAASVERPAAVLVAVPAERDPIVAIGLFLRELQRAAGNAEVLVWLVSGAGASAQERRKYWRDFTALQRLPIGVELAPES